MKSNHIVLTTIYEPHVIFDLQKNISRYGHLDDTVCWVVGDKKTPPSCAALCQSVSNLGLETHFLDVEEQDRWGRKFPGFYRQIPFNNESRRNIGYLHALEHGCERLISVDDDNFPAGDDFIGSHSRTGKPWSGRLVEEATGFHNICEHLTIEPDRLIFPRGFPFEMRNKRNNYKSVMPAAEVIIGISSGLWINEPDVDAITRINGKITSKKYHGPPSLVLSQTTWSPINTQNTSVWHELIPSFLCIPMGFELPGGCIERYGDIWSGYLLQSIIRDTPYHASFGYPVVEHRRNEHDCMEDLRLEYWGMLLTDWFLSLLREDFRPAGPSIIDRVLHLSVFLQDAGRTKLPRWCPEEVQDFIDQTAKTLVLWANVCRQIKG